MSAVAFVRRHPLASLMLWFTAVGQPIAFLPVIAREVYHVELDTDRLLVVATVLGLLLPALVIRRLSEGSAGLRTLLREAMRFDVPPRWYLLPLVAVPLVVAVLTWQLPADAAVTIEAYLGAFLPALLLQFGTTNWWEEIVWMGFVQAPLQERHGAWRAALLTTPLFAVQHVSLVVGGSLLRAALEFAVLTVVIVFARALFGWVYNRTGSLALVGLTHAASNAVTFSFMPRLHGETGQGALALVALGLLALAVSRGRLGHRRDDASRAPEPAAAVRRTDSDPAGRRC